MPKPKAATWETNIRRLVRDAHGQGWSLRGKGEGTTQITRRWSDGGRSSATVPIPWERGAGPALLATIERLERMTAPKAAGGQGLPLAKAAGLIAIEDGTTKAAAIRAGAVDWPAAAERFRHHRVVVTGEVSVTTWQTQHRLYVNQTLALLAKPRGPRDAESLLTALIKAHPTAPGCTGRRTRLATAAGLLRFAVQRCGAAEQWLPPADLSPWVGKRRDRKSDGVPLLDDQALRIYRAIGDPGWRLAWGLLVVFGLRPAELDHCRPEGGALRVGGVKRNAAGGAAASRLVHALDPEGFPGMGATLLALLAERGPAALPPRLAVARRSTTIQKHLRRWVPEWEELVKDAEAAGQGHLTIYSCRHGYAFRGTQLGLDHRTLSKLMGHTPAVHLRHYGRWSSDESVAAAVAAALAARGQPPQPCTYGAAVA